MLGFMDYIQNAFYNASGWNRDNSYSSITATAQALLEFETPTGLRLHVSSLPSPNFATSYTIANRGTVDGSLSYLYTSLPLLSTPSKSTHIPLRSVIQGYRCLSPLRPPEQDWEQEIWQGGKRIDTRDTLLYGRIFLPQRRLEALYLRRLSPTRLLKISAVSDNTLPDGGTLLGEVKTDHGKYSTEYLYSTDSALLGFRGLYNFGPDPRRSAATLNRSPIICGPLTIPAISSAASNTSATEPTANLDAAHAPGPETPPPSLFSLGTELYYGLLNKTVGLSTGLRFTTLPTPSHPSFPYTMTLTLNPLMGNLSSTYAVKAGPNLSLCSSFDFNFYSYESRVMVGGEVWRMKRGDVGWARRKIRPGWGRGAADEEVEGVLRARVDQEWRIGLIWEGRFKEILFSVGARLDLKRREQLFRGLGCEVMYSS